MPLYWSIQDVENYEELMGPEGREPDAWGEIEETFDELMTKCIVFATMHVGINSITEKNVDEFITRVRMIEDVGTKFWYKAGGDYQRIPASAIRRRIGLGTNASTYTKSEFEKHVIRRMRENAARVIKQEDREQEKEAA